MRAIAECVPHGTAVVADIGADHGLLLVEVLRSGRAARGIACDLREDPLRTAARTAARAGTSDRVELRLGDGLAPLHAGEADVVCIAGLGGATVRDVLTGGEGRLEGVQRLVLNPLRAEHHVRGWLRDHGWDLRAEHEIVEDGHYYAVLVAEPGDDDCDDAYADLELDRDAAMTIGPWIARGPSEHTRRRFEAELEHVQSIPGDRLAPRREVLERVVAFLRAT